MSVRALQAAIPAEQTTHGDDYVRHASGIVTSGLRRFAQEELETFYAERASGGRVMVSLVVPQAQPFAITVRLLERINDFIHSLGKTSTHPPNACGRVVVYVAEVPHEQTIAEQLLSRNQVAVPSEQRELVAGFVHLRLLRHGLTTRASAALLDERLLSY